MFIYRAKRYGSSVEHECAALDDAIKHAASDIEWNAASPLEVVDKTGAVVLSRDELWEQAEAVLEPAGKGV